ncbi:urea carboxylase [Bacillus ectoiniformans]|uniref:carboxyltransferase domain-containing protein n=1 Tax=Bacillus ectoiniformans TaxID=1494429 RepID=UPI00195C29C2|nr:urea carboxylase [Bacillus ectoiniformans]
MFTLPETRFDLCGDEYIYAEITKEMSAESNFKAIVITNELRRRNIPGIIEIYPANASYLIRYQPDVISPSDLLDYLKEIDITKSNTAELHFKSRIIEIPIWYDDPVTKNYSEKFQQRNVHTGLSDFDYVMQINGFKDKNKFLDALTNVPHLVTMLGFSPGLAWAFPLGTAKRNIIQAPKYTSPRTETPKQAVGIGGAFSVIYPVNTPGSYQLIGMSAVPVYDQQQKLNAFSRSMFLTMPGDMRKHRSVNEDEYHQICASVKEGTYEYKMKEIEFSAEEYYRKKHLYIKQLMEDFYIV